MCGVRRKFPRFIQGFGCARCPHHPTHPRQMFYASSPFSVGVSKRKRASHPFSIHGFSVSLSLEQCLKSKNGNLSGVSGKKDTQSDLRNCPEEGRRGIWRRFCCLCMPMRFVCGPKVYKSFTLRGPGAVHQTVLTSV